MGRHCAWLHSNWELELQGKTPTIAGLDIIDLQHVFTLIFVDCVTSFLETCRNFSLAFLTLDLRGCRRLRIRSENCRLRIVDKSSQKAWAVMSGFSAFSGHI